jgi:hypothetical protein
MNFQEKLLEASAELRARAAALAASSRVEELKKSIAVLNGARLELRKVAGQHARHFVKQNSALVLAVRKDVSELARSTFASLSKRPATRKARRAPAARKRSAKAA